MSHAQPQASRPNMAPGYGILSADSGSGLLPWSWVDERMARARNYWVCTTRPDGRPHAAPIWGVWVEGELYFGTDRASRKGRNLAHNPALVVHLESGDETVICEGVAEQVGDAALLERINVAYAEKYNLPLTGEGAPEGVIYRLRPNVVLAWLETDFPGGATRWHFGAATSDR
jgi:nitroimidazol reductase NimA-like FMN-containing flavoprotein (pyridoxamine 5'-phosphate oxidase superfamily)